MLVLLVGVVSAVPATDVSYFYSVTCSHCGAVLDSGSYRCKGLARINAENIQLNHFLQQFF